jgi:peroxiredoxin 2/4
MKKNVILLALFCLITTLVWSQNETKIPLIGDKAPTFTALSTKGVITFPDDYGHKWKILFSHPRDFTPVCSTELLELANMQQDFDVLNAQLVVMSTDKIRSHKDWKAALETVDFKGEGAKEINFPIVADESMAASKTYGMLHYPVSTSKDVRGVFIINPDNIVEAVYFYPMNVGRNMDEIKRSLIALQTTEKSDNVSTPADWQPGDDVLLNYLTANEKANLDSPSSYIYQPIWFITYKKSD